MHFLRKRYFYAAPSCLSLFLTQTTSPRKVWGNQLTNFITLLKRFFFRLLILAGVQCVSMNVALPEPVRVASLNLCTDQLVLTLADPEQIASITFLSQHQESSFMAEEALRHHINYGQAEELIVLQPDLVVTLTYTTPTTLRLLRHLGFKVELFSPAKNIAGVMANIRRMAELLGQKARGEKTVQAMKARLEFIASPYRGPTLLRGLLYEPNGYTAGAQTLRGELIRLAGWHNIASEVGIKGVGVIGLETLILAGPDRLILSPYAPGTHSLGQRVLNHPAVSAVTSQRDPLIVSPKLWMCGGPMNTEAVARLIEGQ